jgi:hypothetical protein
MLELLAKRVLLAVLLPLAGGCSASGFQDTEEAAGDGMSMLRQRRSSLMIVFYVNFLDVILIDTLDLI